MQYLWVCIHCNHEETVSRRLADIDVGPDARSCTKHDGKCEFTRIIPKLVTPGINGYRLQGTGWAYDGYRSRNKDGN